MRTVVDHLKSYLSEQLKINNETWASNGMNGRRNGNTDKIVIRTVKICCQICCQNLQKDGQNLQKDGLKNVLTKKHAAHDVESHDADGDDISARERHQNAENLIDNREDAF